MDASSARIEDARARRRIFFALAPAFLIILVLFGGGLLFGFMQSVGYFPVAGLTDFTLEHYLSVLTDRNFLISLWITFRIAASVTILSAVMAIAFCFVLREQFRGSKLATFLFQLPLPVPHLVAASATILLLSQSGLFARFSVGLGLIDSPRDFPALLYDEYGIGIMISFLWKEVPFVGLVVLAVLQSVGPQYEEIAQTLGANRWQRFRYVLLPLILPGVFSTSIIVFAFTFANFEIPLLLGETFPTTLPVQAFREFEAPELSRRPKAMAMALVLAFITILLLIAYKRLLRGTRTDNA